MQNQKLMALVDNGSFRKNVVAILFAASSAFNSLLGVNQLKLKIHGGLNGAEAFNASSRLAMKAKQKSKIEQPRGSGT